METISIPRPVKKREPRDLFNFIQLRQALPSDDLAIGELLIHTFESTYSKKLPNIATTDERRRELRNVGPRRKEGYVCVAELGYKIIGSFALIHPESTANEAWGPSGAMLRCVAIDPAFHGLQLSELLLMEADRVALAWDCQAIYLHVQNGADKVAQLYQRHGYRRDRMGDKVSHGNSIEGYSKDLELINALF